MNVQMIGGGYISRGIYKVQRSVLNNQFLTAALGGGEVSSVTPHREHTMLESVLSIEF
jgi:hypothetical protein